MRNPINQFLTSLYLWNTNLLEAKRNRRVASSPLHYLNLQKLGGYRKKNERMASERRKEKGNQQNDGIMDHSRQKGLAPLQSATMEKHLLQRQRWYHRIHWSFKVIGFSKILMERQPPGIFPRRSARILLVYRISMWWNALTLAALLSVILLYASVGALLPLWYHWIGTKQTC